jgi:hypothetical protein
MSLYTVTNFLFNGQIPHELSDSTHVYLREFTKIIIHFRLLFIPYVISETKRKRKRNYI